MSESLTGASSSKDDSTHPTLTGEDTEMMTDAIWAAALMLQSNAKPEMNYWYDLKQVVEMMELYETTTRDKKSKRKLRSQVIQVCHTQKDEQGRLVFLIRGIKGASGSHQAGITEWVIKRSTTGV